MTARETCVRRIGAALAILLVATKATADDRDFVRTIVAEVVALDQPMFYNRLGAQAPDGMIYALARDVVNEKGEPIDLRPGHLNCQPGHVWLRKDKRPRPIVLRMNVGDCLELRFTNLLAPAPRVGPNPNKVPGATTRYAGVSVMGLEVVNDPGVKGPNTGSNVGANESTLAPAAAVPKGAAAATPAAAAPEPYSPLDAAAPPVPADAVGPAQSRTYRYYASAEGTFFLTSYADTDTVPTNSQQLSGLFGAVNIQPRGAEYYRSQVTQKDMIAATYDYKSTDDVFSLPGRRPRKLEALKETDAGSMLPADATSKFQAVTRTAQELGRMMVLNDVDPSRRAEHPIKVYMRSGRLYGETGHPLINYQSVFRTGPRQGLPVLSMLQTVPATDVLFDVEVEQIPRDLVDGIVPRKLAAAFKSRVGIELSDHPEVTDEDGPAWRITDKGKVYVLRLEGAGDQEKLVVRRATLELVYTDLTAIITGPNAGRFPLSNDSPSFRSNPVYPDRRQPFREYTIIYHQNSPAALQAFPVLPKDQAIEAYGNKAFSFNYQPTGGDNFGINYGFAGIGAEVLANRIGVGPMGVNGDEVDLKFEEFFLSAWAVGDPAMVVDRPANSSLHLPSLASPTEAATPSDAGNPPNTPPLVGAGPPTRQALRMRGTPAAGGEDPKRATFVLYPDDPSNVYHSYMRDHVKFRILHAGTAISHVHHLHAHQWLHSPDSDHSAYLDSQLITPGLAYTLEIVYGGSGNRNMTVGDSIFHCHFYPHFAQGMWSLWRVHDTFEEGTELEPDGRKVKAGARALPDGEIVRGTPIPAIVPLPTLAMAPLPAEVKLVDNGRTAEVTPTGHRDGKPYFGRNPGYPFFIPGKSGHRAPHPPLDFAWKESSPGTPALVDGKKQYLDGGLPRHLVLGGDVVREFHTRWDWSKDFVLFDKFGKLTAGKLTAVEIPEDGTPVEQAAMAAHSRRTHTSIQPDGNPGNFLLNGLPPAPGAPFAPPEANDAGNSVFNYRRYKAAAVQLDVVLNKKGWHYPQQRFLTLWNDVKPTVEGTRAPQPLFFRANTGDSIEYWHTNLVPAYYELDDFQVRTPTDVIGQHIHLVKFDVTASDGAGNGFNYEDGTFSPQEVRERIEAINADGGLFAPDGKTRLPRLKVKDYRKEYQDSDKKPIFGDAPPGQNWDGAQTTVQRWDTDPLMDNDGQDRNLRTVFTHDHFGPSTHQQTGLYAGLLVEPEASYWLQADGTRMNTRGDGGPTSWEGIVVPANPSQSYREFALEFQDMQLAYNATSNLAPSLPTNPLFHFDPNLLDGLLYDGVPRNVRDEFSFAGVTLLKKAIIEAVPAPAGGPTTEWTVIDVLDDGTVRATYRVKKGPPTGGGTDVCNVFLTSGPRPAMASGWSAPAHALGAPPSNSGDGAPYPQLVSNQGLAAMSLNYRNESASLRVAPNTGVTVKSEATDPAYALSSRYTRADSDLNRQPAPYASPFDKAPFKNGPRRFPAALSPGTLGPDAAKGQITDFDPYTPVLRAYAGDRVQVRTLVGAHVSPHSFQMSGVRWLFEPGDYNSGWRNAQGMGLSEHFEMIFTIPSPTATQDATYPLADYWYAANSDPIGLTNGLWGILRAYNNEVPSLEKLPSNRDLAPIRKVDFAAEFAKAKNPKEFKVTALVASLVYNNRTPIKDPNAIIYVNSDDLEADPDPAALPPKLKIKANITQEPLILRVAAGDWIKITIRNGVNPNAPSFPASRKIASPPFNSPSPQPNVSLNVSTHVGLHPSLVSYDVTAADGMNVGYNPEQTVSANPATLPNKDVFWYAGILDHRRDGTLHQIPVEFGAVNLVPADPIVQHQVGLYGALIVEPEGSAWVEDAGQHAAATVTRADGTAFRDLAIVWQSDVQNGNMVTNLKGAINYRTEPFAARNMANPVVPTGFEAAFSNKILADATHPDGFDPQTPVFLVPGGMPTRLRMFYPGGAQSFASGVKPLTLVVQGHNWQEEPFVDFGAKMGDNRLSQHFGAQILSPYESSNFALSHAGGRFGVMGDYLFHSYQQENNPQANGLGTWGLLRVADAPTIRRARLDGNILNVDGFLNSASKAAKADEEVTVFAYAYDVTGKLPDASTKKQVATAKVGPDGSWKITSADKAKLTSGQSYITAESARPTTIVPLYVKVR